MQTILRGAKVYRDGVFTASDIFVEDGIVVGITDSGAQAASFGDEEFEYNDMVILPGLVDVHVHLREPGFSYKEDIASGTAAAAAGGYTDVCSMPNLVPAPDSVQGLSAQLDAIADKALIHVHPYGCITKGSKGAEQADMEAIADSVIAYSDDGTGVVSDAMMESAMITAGRLGRLIAAHCEYKELKGGDHVNAGPAADAFDIAGISNESEWKMIERDIELARRTGAAYHVCHVSTKESVDLIRRAKAEGVDITCETAPHYVLLDDTVFLKGYGREGEPAGRAEQGEPVSDGTAGEDGEMSEPGSVAVTEAERRGIPEAYFKMNPPLRRPEDRKAVLDGLLDGTIDMIATDHAPHSWEEKHRPITESPMGVVGLECAFPVMFTGLVKSGIITLEKLVGLMTTAPAERFGIESGIRTGCRANLCVYDLNAEYVIEPEEFMSMGRATPFAGETVYGRCVATWCDGRPVWTGNR